MVTEVRSLKNDLSKALDFIWLEITPKCNLKCVHCYADSGPKRVLSDGLNLADWYDVMKEASQLGCKKLQFIGGEPTAHPDLGDLITEARKLGFSTVEVYTNGTTIGANLKAVLKQQRVNLAFSIYGADAPIHDSVTTVSGSFDRTIACIKWALASDLTVRVGFIKMPQNTGSWIHTKHMLQEIGVKSIGIDNVRGVGRGSVQANFNSPMEELCGQCWRGKLCVTSSGDIFPCVFSRFAKVGRFEQGLATTLRSAELSYFRETI